MNKFKHTPGPWSFNMGYIGSKREPFVSCNRQIYDGMHIHNGGTLEERIANARLVSVTPEMLNLLIEMGKFGEDQYPDDPDTGLFGSARKLAEKAIGLTWEEIKGDV